MSSEKVRGVVTDITRLDITNDEVMDKYKVWAQSYDEDLSFIEYNPPKIGASELSKLLGDNKNALILDAAAGTGLVAIELKKNGFQNIDALDASAEMLEKAKEKKLYNNVICDFMGPNRLDIKDDTYDGVVTVGSFCPGHVNGSCLAELIRIVKPGGYIVIALKKVFLPVLGYNGQGLHEIMDEHTKAGRWDVLANHPIPRYHEMEEGMLYIFRIKVQGF
ncbi:methyltransferase-like protein 27 [Lingula anatina]|uniref:Methyltransferase-like protein 27 n=1 Tax=Lingula anatina TaxID=7574 RepID=A0A1S3HP31_LINAN|nr:methyltransferase-like protein 27 [Lingula anatina]|eukprot:XP_013386794.1 methyltransferase-like protein 27 [Lingula anatina]